MKDETNFILAANVQHYRKQIGHGGCIYMHFDTSGTYQKYRKSVFFFPSHKRRGCQEPTGEETFYYAEVLQQVPLVIWCAAKCSVTVSSKVNSVEQMKAKLNDGSIFPREKTGKDFLHPNGAAAVKAHSFLFFRLNALSLAVCALQWSVLHRYFLLYRGPWAPQAIGVN